MQMCRLTTSSVRYKLLFTNNYVCVSQVRVESRLCCTGECECFYACRCDNFWPVAVQIGRRRELLCEQQSTSILAGVGTLLPFGEKGKCLLQLSIAGYYYPVWPYLLVVGFYAHFIHDIDYICIDITITRTCINRACLVPFHAAAMGPGPTLPYPPLLYLFLSLPLFMPFFFSQRRREAAPKCSRAYGKRCKL